ncbi:MAG: hypothetical protein VB137_13145 [Burkholderia sp.]
MPCEDPFRRVFSGVSSVAFKRCFIEWAGHLCSSLAGLHFAIDGKTVHSNAGRSGHTLHLISAWRSDKSSLISYLNPRPSTYGEDEVLS